MKSKAIKPITIKVKEIPQWHVDEVRKLLNDYKNNPRQALDFDEVIDGIEKTLNAKS